MENELIKTSFLDMDIHFSIEGITIHALNISLGRIHKTIPSHRHGAGCYEIHYIAEGYGKADINGQHFDITPNTLYVTGPDIEHAQLPLADNPMKEYCIYLKFPKHWKKTKNTPIVETFTRNSFWFSKDRQGIEQLLRRLFFELSNQPTGYQLAIESLLSQIIIYIVRNYEQKVNDTLRTFSCNKNDSITVIIDEYFLNEYPSLSLNTLANRLNLSPRQTQRLLKEYYGKTFHQKKADARMSAAAIMLYDNTQSIAKISEVLGYSSPEYFSNAFKAYYKKSPSEYRRKQYNVKEVL